MKLKDFYKRQVEEYKDSLAVKDRQLETITASKSKLEQKFNKLKKSYENLMMLYTKVMND